MVKLKGNGGWIALSFFAEGTALGVDREERQQRLVKRVKEARKGQGQLLWV